MHISWWPWPLQVGILEGFILNYRCLFFSLQGSVQCKAPEIEFQDPSASGYFQNQSGSSLNIADVFDFGGLWILTIKVALQNRPQNGVLQLLIQI